MEKEIKPVTIQEISEIIGMDSQEVKKYIEGPLKEDVEKEKLVMGEGKYDPFIIDLIMIELEVDSAGERLQKTLETIRRKKDELKG